MSNPGAPLPIVPAGFFALRTPLLPLDALLAWSGDALGAPAALAHGRDALADALEADRAALRARLREIVARPEVREALFVASPSLDESLAIWAAQPASERGQKVERTLVRYLARMAGRATPFGLFAGCAVGEVGTAGATTRLSVPPHASCRRHTRLDNDYVCALTEALGAGSALRAALAYRPNSSLYNAAGRLRYAEVRLHADRTRSHHLVAVEPTEYLDALLARADEPAGALLEDLARALAADTEVDLDQARGFVGELVDTQLLVPASLEPAVTGPEPLPGLIAQLARAPELADVTASLARVSAALEAIDARSPGSLPPDVAYAAGDAAPASTSQADMGAPYRAIARELEALPVPVDLPRLFQVDMVKPTVPGEAPPVLGRAVLDALTEAATILHRLGPGADEDDGLGAFRDAFVARYEDREVPLVEALDEEVGVGFVPAGSRRRDTAPLLDGLAFPDRRGSSAGAAAWTARHGVLLARLSRALRDGETEIALSAEELDAIATREPAPLPDAFAVLAQVVGAPSTLARRADVRVYVSALAGPSGATLLGRFCHADPALHARVREHLRAEEALRPEAVFAEVVHLPEGRVGNILARPVLREYEIPFLGRSGAPDERQIRVTDLYVSVVNGRVVLRSERLGREVVPRLTNAHNYFAGRGLGVYQFLCALQGQGVAGGLGWMGWSWGPLDDAPYLPRVTAGRGVVLARAQWRVPAARLKALAQSGRGDEVAQYAAVQALRAELRLPRWVVLADGDNELRLDLDNALSVATLAALLRDQPGVVLHEMFPGPEALAAQGPEGRYVHELVVPFVRKPAATTTTTAGVATTVTATAAPAPGPAARATDEAYVTSGSEPVEVARAFPPGDEWLYVKLYTGTATADQILRAEVAPFVRDALARGVADRWFFLRFNDPDWHLRLRLHGAPDRLLGEALPALRARLAPYLAHGGVHRVQLDTYERELERYGGPVGIELAEQLFHADSEAALAIVAALAGDAGTQLRARVALRGIDALLEDLGLDLPGRRAVIRRAREDFGREFRADARLERQLGDRYRAWRDALGAMLAAPLERDGEGDDGAAGTALRRVATALRARRARLEPIADALRAAEREGRLSATVPELAGSFVHMHVNRVLRSEHRAQELVLYDLLDRLYASMIARAR